MHSSRYELLRTIADADGLYPDLTQPYSSVFAKTANPADLQRLAAEGLITGQAVTYSPCCPECERLTMRLNGSCPACHSYALATTPLVHHIPCAGIFEAPDGMEAITDCPKCRNAIGADQSSVEAVGEMHRCAACQAQFPEPAMRMYCSQCDTNHPMHDLRFYPIHCYHITPAGEALLQGDAGE